MSLLSATAPGLLATANCWCAARAWASATAFSMRAAVLVVRAEERERVSMPVALLALAALLPRRARGPRLPATLCNNATHCRPEDGPAGPSEALLLLGMLLLLSSSRACSTAWLTACDSSAFGGLLVVLGASRGGAGGGAPTVTTMHVPGEGGKHHEKVAPKLQRSDRTAQVSGNKTR